MIHILPNISRSKGNQTMEFGQSIEYKLRNIFLEKSCINFGIETILRLFSKNSYFNVFLINFLFNFFIYIACKVEGYRNTLILKLSCRSITLTSYKALLKNNKRPSELVSQTSKVLFITDISDGLYISW